MGICRTNRARSKARIKAKSHELIGRWMDNYMWINGKQFTTLIIHALCCAQTQRTLSQGESAFLKQFTLSKKKNSTRVSLCTRFEMSPRVKSSAVVVWLHNFHRYLYSIEQIICFEIIDHNVISRHSLFELLFGWILVMLCNRVHKSTWSA